MSEEFERDATGVEDGDSQESTNSTTDAADAGQPNGTDRRIIEAGKTKQKINLDEYPEFRQWKSEYDKRLAQTEQRYQQMLAQQQQELRNRQLSEMDDYQRLQFELEEERQAKAYAYQQLQQVQVETAKQQALNEISATMGVPVNVLTNAQDINEAWRMAAQYQQQSAQRKAEEQAAAAAEKQRQRQEKQQRNAVDTGSGGGTVNDWQRQYQTFQQRRDPWSMFNHALSNTTQE